VTSQDRFELKHVGYGPSGTPAYVVIDTKTGARVKREDGQFLLTQSQAIELRYLKQAS
jgi:hypothetical protein